MLFVSLNLITNKWFIDSVAGKAEALSPASGSLADHETGVNEGINDGFRETDPSAVVKDDIRDSDLFQNSDEPDSVAEDKIYHLGYLLYTIVFFLMICCFYRNEQGDVNQAAVDVNKLSVATQSADVPTGFLSGTDDLDQELKARLRTYGFQVSCSLILFCSYMSHSM